MNEVDRWIYFGGPAPASVRPLLDSLRAGEAAPPGVEVETRVIEDFLANFEERVARASEEGEEGEEGEVDSRRSDVYAVRSAPARAAEPGGGGDALDGAVSGASNRLRGTAEAAEVREAMGRLPFLALGSASATPVNGIARTLQVRAMPSVGETLALGSDAIQKAVAAVPFGGSGGGAGGVAVVTFPELTVQQYVSLRADLVVRPDQLRETLRRYGVPNEAAQRALEAYWEERLAGSAELRAERDAAVGMYTRWLRGE